MKTEFVIVLLMIFGSFSVLSYAQEIDTGRTDYSSPEFEDMVPSERCDCVAFRFDDIQNGWLYDVQIAVLDKFIEKKIPLTIGIIGNFLEGDMANHVKKITSENDSLIEIANHGWLHEDFTVLDKKTQGQLMEKTNKRILDVTGKSPQIFIPPYNVYNGDTIESMKEHNFSYFSPNVFNSQPPYPLVNSELYNFPETSTTGIKTPGLNLFEGLSHVETLKDIRDSQKVFGFSVVTLHPQEFSVIENDGYANRVNSNQIQELELLFEEIQKSNLKIVFLNQIDKSILEHSENIQEPTPESTQTQIDPPSLQLEAGPADIEVQKIPDWIKNTMQWYLDDIISEDEMISAIQFLVKEGIIILD